jgi:gamma-glutamyltranspeptidase/glutathione hydrolase
MRSHLLVVALASSCAHGNPPELQQPETATGFRSVARSRARQFMAATANPDATAAAVEILRTGGNALDAAVAAQMALAVTEPQSSGLGGGTFLVYYDSGAARLFVYDGRETAPAGFAPDAFLEVDGRPMKTRRAMVGGLSVGVPGTLAVLERAHTKHGNLPWRRLFEPAISLASEGWNVHRRLANALGQRPGLLEYAGEGSAFFDESGRPRQRGDRVTHPTLAATLRQVAQEGSHPFYRGEIGAEIVRVVTTAKNPGSLSTADLAAYAPEVREPLCTTYRRYTLCGAPPPAGSGVAITILKLLEPFELASLEPNSAEFMHLFAQASMLAYADRDTYYGDPAFADVPMAELLAPERLRSGREQITSTRLAPEPKGRLIPLDVERIGHPVCKTNAGGAGSMEEPSTSHVSIMDGAGNVASMTSSVEASFGSVTMAGGFVLNNQLTDFDFEPCAGGALKANAALPGKRPRSSMSPIIVLDGAGQPILAAGSPGGAAIIAYTAQALIAVLDWGMDPQDAVALPHLLARKGTVFLEDHPSLDPALPTQLETLGHRVTLRSLTSGLSLVLRAAGDLQGGVDPRRDGIAAGD